jgi:hypothetical protein
VWGIFFWPAECNRSLVNSPQGLPLVVSMRFQVVNVGLIPKMIHEVSLTIARSGEVHRFDPYALMGPDCFARMETGWQSDKKELFRPLTVGPRSSEDFHFLFVPVGPKQTRLRGPRAGGYECTLSFLPAGGRPVEIRFAINVSAAPE